ncbi:MAG: HEAT repeat domain-containing protein [Vicinamibacterales bacterium]
MKRFAGLLVLLLVVTLTQCATPPPPPPPVAPSYEEKLSWILRLEDQRLLRDPAPPPVSAPVPVNGRSPVVAPVIRVPDLTTLLTDADARLRRRAALAIGRVGLADGVAPLLAVLTDADPDVRAMACFSLGLLDDARAVEPLLVLLTDADLRVQGRAAEALGAIGDPRAAAPVGQMVARHAADPVVIGLAPDEMSTAVPPAADAYRLGVAALVGLKSWEALAGAVLSPEGRLRVAWWPTAFALQRIEDRRAVPVLIDVARGPALEPAAFAVRGLGVLKDARAVDVLTTLLTPGTRDRRLVAGAVRSLGQIGRPEFAPALLRVLRTAQLDSGTRVEAIVALGLLKTRDAVEDLLDLLGHTDPAIRGAALTAVASIDPDTFTTALSGLDPDPAWYVRVDLARALATLETSRAVPRLLELLRDTDRRVAAAALQALADTKAPQVMSLLQEFAAVDDVALRSTAATVIGTLKPANGAVWLQAAWTRSRTDVLNIARLSIVDALAAYGLEAARPTLEEALADPDWAVRLRAATALRKLDSSADIGRSRPAPTRYQPGDYNRPAFIAPPYTPSAYIDTSRGTIQLELYVLDAPLTVASFIELARKGYFNGLPIHRVVPNFVVQGGDPRGDGEGGPGYTIRDELNMRPYLRGTVGMALAGPDTGGSQFFMTHGPQPHLDGHYTVFGGVVAGMDVVDRLERWDVIERVRIWDGVEPPASSSH